MSQSDRSGMGWGALILVVAGAYSGTVSGIVVVVVGVGLAVWSMVAS